MESRKSGIDHSEMVQMQSSEFRPPHADDAEQARQATSPDRDTEISVSYCHNGDYLTRPFTTLPPGMS